MQQRIKSQWNIFGRIDDASLALSNSLNITPVAARVLLNRGIHDAATAGHFMNPSLCDLHDPFLMQDMDKAVERLRRAVRDKEKILIHGDYDVDGITATAMMVRILSSLEADVAHHIPHRVLEGYGVSAEAIKSAAAEGVKLVVTVDCGITAHAEARLAQELGLDLIITDHHQPHVETRNQDVDLPNAVAVLNPNRPDCAYPFKGLCGCGVAFKLASALTESLGHSHEHLQRAFLDLTALGTIADVVPLVDENRILARYGLERLAETKKQGLRALMEIVGLKGKALTSQHVGFLLGPRLNAAGRLDSATTSLNLLLSRDDAEAKRLAETLQTLNRERQSEEAATLEDACFMIQSGEDACGSPIALDTDKALVLASDNWHVGVIGIVASRLAERYHRPTILIAMDQDRGKGSGRSIPAFHLFKALDRCRDFVIQCGGHKQAAGLSITREQLPAFREQFLKIAGEELMEDDLVPQVKIDCELRPEDVTYQLAQELIRLEPFGEGNPKPLFVVRGATLLMHSLIGQNGEHLKLRVRYGNATYDCLWWRNGERFDSFSRNQPVDLCFSLEINEYQGMPSLQFILKDARPSEGAGGQG